MIFSYFERLNNLAGAPKTNTPRTVFCIAYHYPPIRSTGVERTVKFARYLPEFGYDVKILTTSAFGASGQPNVLHAWEPLQWYRYLFNRGAASSAVRTGAGQRGGVRRWLRTRLCVPDLQTTWLPAALWRALRELRHCPAALIYSTYPPASAHLLGLLLKALSGRPWVADFRDSWVYDPLDPTLNQLPYRRALERRLEERVVNGADAVIVATDVSAEHLRRTYPQAADRIEVIANGFDPEDFAFSPPPPKEALQLVHAGSFSLSHPRRDPGPLFAALEAMLDEDPAWAQRLHLILVGQLSAGERQAAARLEQLGVVEITGAVERDAALARQQDAHVLLLVDHVRPWPSSNVPGKFYEYLATRRPILALAGCGMVERLMRQLRAGTCVAADDPGAIAAALADLYQRFSVGALKSQVDGTQLRRFHRRALTRQLAACFDRVGQPPSAAPPDALS